MTRQPAKRDARDIRICQCAPGGTINVQGPCYGRTFGRGAQVDFAERVAPDVDVTWGQALDRYAHVFVAAEQSSTASTQAQQPVAED